MGVDKVDWPGAGRGENAKIITLREERIECPECVRPRIVAARDIRLSAESRFQRNVREPVTGFRSHCPGPYVCGTEGSELPERFIVEIPAGLYLGDGTRETRTDTVPHIVADTSVECSYFSIEAKVVGVQRGGLRQRMKAREARSDRWTGDERNWIRIRAGRHEMEYGSARLIDVREGPNVRLSFDGFKVKVGVGSWQIDGFAVCPDLDKPGFFDDAPNHAIGFWGVYGVRPLHPFPYFPITNDKLNQRDLHGFLSATI